MVFWVCFWLATEFAISWSAFLVSLTFNSSAAVILPVVLLNFIVAIHMRFMAQKAIKSREVRYRWFRVYEGTAPEYMLMARDHYKGFFEIPILFYLLCVILFSMNDVTSVDLWIAWLFVLTKFVHSYIRMTSNYVPYRAYSFYICFLILFCGWVNLVIKII